MSRKSGRTGPKTGRQRRVFKPRAGRTYYAYDKGNKALYRFANFSARLEAMGKNAGLKVVGALEHRDLVAQDTKHQIKYVDLRNPVVAPVAASEVFQSPQAVSALAEAIAERVASQLKGVLPSVIPAIQPHVATVAARAA